SFAAFILVPGNVEMAEQIFAAKVALVTGASSGIGRASAIALAERGADVALNYYSLEESAQAAAKQIQSMGQKALLFAVDVSGQTAVEAMVAKTVAELGRIDLLVCSAVYSDRELFWKADMAGFRRTLEVSMMGAYYVLRAVTNVMIRQGQGGSVVVVSSPHARVAIPSCMAYNMAKAANDQMARTAAVELLKHKIRVNIVHPGWTDTPGERKYFSEEVLRNVGPTLPLGRMAQPEEIARGVIFLLDPASDYVTGATLSIDGGSQLPYWSKRGTGEF
ncbi:MAG TPA: SDR family oxidoreductase, partial [Gemmataceae bacterium]|nr:SDR family oxidoreductase [Gemmataceae bacterium]